MPSTPNNLTSIVEDYLSDLRRIRASGGATGERSTYGPLANLLNDVGATLRPKVFCVGELAEQGAGHPDFGLYTAKQVQRGKPRDGQLPECGVVEVKPPGDDAWLTAQSDQVSRYWNRYRLVLVTNTRDFILIGEDSHGNPAKLETFRLADSEESFLSLSWTYPEPSPSPARSKGSVSSHDGVDRDLNLRVPLGYWYDSTAGPNRLREIATSTGDQK